MKNRVVKPKQLNGSLTRTVIELQDRGYDCDFLLLANGNLLCMQNNRNYPLSSVSIQNMDQGFDWFSQSYKHIHIIETGNGERGVLLSEHSFA
ncbi:hypothetical protein [Pedobacter nototheniae]|uniref:hypothetical protein n=1 Tax=Pedobacter nototheniae TaxID=2488994 RepID=UPI0010403FF4|nr:hypothetical protein [Pedobacter nototheniae]